MYIIVSVLISPDKCHVIFLIGSNFPIVPALHKLLH